MIDFKQLFLEENRGRKPDPKLEADKIFVKCDSRQ